MIQILRTMPLTTVQDLGRPGSRRYGVGTSGAMDPVALQVGNTMLGNDAGAAAIEVSLPGFRVRFDRDSAFALTGADYGAMLDDKAILPWWAGTAKSGQELQLNGPATSGMRAYLCVSGGLAVPPILGSRSTQLRGGFGGHLGRPLQNGDVLDFHADFKGQLNFGVVPPHAELPDSGEDDDQCLTVRVMPAGEFEYFTDEAKTVFREKSWTITPQSNRVGYRLAGEPLLMKNRFEMRSHGIVPGVIQVPPSGQPIIALADAAVSGGYPKIATVISADMWKLGQAKLGRSVRFVEVNADLALEALRQVREYLGKVAAAAARARELF